jgi:transcriptional regulator with XRE-family HTH domain
MQPEKAFGSVLRGLRSERGLSQARLAQEAGLDRTYVSMLERGRRQPSLDTMIRLAEALSITLTVLARRVDEALQR